jgi:hypothetical protein
MQSVSPPAPPAEFAPLLRPSMLRPAATRKPISTQIVQAAPLEAPSVVVAPAAHVEDQPVWHARLDISVWRLPHSWRLVASFVVRRLGRRGQTPLA